ncbi:MAG TPA: protein kinase [Pyrinomonadaceae bacterium]|nr:protein kinase [Pyrinomonadaceae bacterium]
MSVKPGTKLGRYEIRSKLGEGGMGEVYRADDTQLDRTVAVKILPADIARDQQRLHRFLQEARTASKLKSANVAHIYEIGEVDGHYFIAMEYVEGQPLNQKIGGKPLEPAEILRIGTQILRAVEEAHSKGITHRDLKPENVIVTHDAEVKVLDFGLAKLNSLESHRATPTADSQLVTEVKTNPGVVMGTVNYMSPEQAMGRDVDHRSDLFSVGVVLYEMTTGRVPFAGSSLTDTIDRIVHKQPEAIARFNYNVPAELEVIIKKALRKNRDERYQTARELLVDLRDLQQELEFASRMEHSIAPQRDETPIATSAYSTRAFDLGQRSHVTSEAAPVPTQVSSAEYVSREIKRHKKGVAIALGVLLVVAIVLVYGLYKLFSNNRRSTLQPGKITRLTNHGKVGNATISPDGKFVAYTALDDLGQRGLWVKYVATGSNVEIVPPVGPDVVFGQLTFSPDGDYIYYLKGERGPPFTLFQVPKLGGTSKKILERATGISFSPDAKRFAFQRRYASEGEDALMVANVDGTGEQKLATRKHPDFLLSGVAWSPDGQTIACPIGGFVNGYYRSISIVNVADGTNKRLTSYSWNDVQRFAWLPNGSGLILSGQARFGDPYQLWQVSFPDGEVQPVTNDLSDYHQVSLTADGTAWAAVLADATANVWLIPNGEWSNGRQLTSSKTNGVSSVAFSPDGRIIYQSRAAGNSDLWIMDFDGRNQKQITDDVHSEQFGSITPDGRYVVFDSSRSGTMQVWRVNLDGSNAKLLTASPGFMEDITPDGKWVVYSTFGPGGFSIWKVSIEGGEAVQVTRRYSHSPAVSPDGKSVAAYIPDERTGATKVAIFPFEGGEFTKSFDVQAAPGSFPYPVRWTPDGRALTYIATRGGVSNIEIQPLDGSPSRRVTDFKTDRIFAFDWSPDGKWLLLSRGPEQRDVVLMTDFK